MRFYELAADRNWQTYGGTWYAHDTSSYSERTYHLVEFINWPDATGDEDGHSPQYLCMSDDEHTDNGRHTRPCPYVVNSGTFYLDDYTDAQLESALSCVGQSLADLPPKSLARDLQILYALQAYYGLGNIYNDSILCGRNARKLLAQAKRRM